MATDQINELAERLTLLHEIFSRRISDRALSVWVQELQPYCGPELDRALDEGIRSERMPSLGELISKVQSLRRAASGPKRDEETERISKTDRDKMNTEALKHLRDIKAKLGITDDIK